MSVPFGTPLLSRPIAAIGLPAARPCIVSRPGLFPDIRPVSTLLMTDYPLLYLPCPGIPFLGIRPPRPRPSPSLLVPSRPFSSPPLYSLFPAPVVPAVFLGGRRFWHENAKYFFIWEIIVNFLLLLAFNVK